MAYPQTTLEHFAARCKTQLGRQVAYANFLLDNPGNHQWPANHDDAEVVCALVNLGIAELWNDQSISLKSEEKARRWIASIN